MRIPNGLVASLTGVAVVGLAGCTASSSTLVVPPYAGSTPPATGSPAANLGVTTVPAAPASTPAPTPTQTGPVEPETTGGARAAASKFYGLYSANQFSASWNLLSPTAQEAIPQAVWIGVHNGCPAAGAGTAVDIKSVIVFGNAAIVTETTSGPSSGSANAEDVFNYTNGHWGYTPNNLSIYHHGSVAADIAAAKELGFCTGAKAVPM